MTATVFPDLTTWKASRKATIGASESAGIFGANPHSSALRVYTSKVEDVEEDETSKMRAGSHFERPAAEFWAAERGYTLVDPTACALHACSHHAPLVSGMKAVWQIPGTPIACTPDFFAEDDGGRYVVEVKVPSPKLLDIDTVQGGWKQGPPLWYQVQVQHQLMVMHECGEHFDQGIIVAYFGSDDVREWFYDADPDLWKAMRSKLLQFWNEHVMFKAPPPPDRFTDAELMRRAWPKAVPKKSVELPPHVVVEFREKKQLLDVAEDAFDKAKVALQSIMGDAELGLVNGLTVCTWKNQTAHFEAKPAKDVTSRVFRTAKGMEQVQ